MGCHQEEQLLVGGEEMLETASAPTAWQQACLRKKDRAGMGFWQPLCKQGSLHTKPLLGRLSWEPRGAAWGAFSTCTYASTLLNGEGSLEAE